MDVILEMGSITMGDAFRAMRRRSIWRLTMLPLFVLAGTLCGLSAQSRIAGDPEALARIAITGSVAPRATIATDLGVLPPDRIVPRVTLRFNLTPAQNAALDQLAADQQNPDSQHYRQWLTPDQYAERFGLGPADLAIVTSWLQSQGLTVTEIARSGTFVAVSGTAAQMDAAFGVKLHTVSLHGQTHFANLGEVTLPSPIAAVVAGVTGLDDFRLTPSSRAHPAYTSSSSGNHYLAPGDFYTIYDINPLLGPSINGLVYGVTIAVLGQTDISLTDVAAFRAASGLPANPPMVKLYATDPGILASDIDEAQLDVEWAGAVAPSATILYVNSAEVISGSLTEAIDNNLAPILSLSYGDCESGFGATNIALYNQLMRQGTVQGQTIVSAAGDSGATDCDSQTAAATQGPAVAFPASSPYVTAVGGTMFNEDGGSYWSAGNGAYSGSAVSYIPEMVWNETAVFGTLEAGGGGASSYFTKPAFQTGLGVPNDYSRDVPDVALAAGSNHDGYLFCSQGFCTNGFRNAAGNLDVSGGTSVATPAFAGILALLEQKLKISIGNANPVIYGLANSSYAGSVFHDITSGSNASPCVAGSTACPGSGSIGYSAATGYDLASGWGSVDAFHFVSDWLLAAPVGLSSGVGQATSVTLLNASAATVSAGTAVTLTAGVSAATSGAAAPTGTVQFLVDNVPVGAAANLSGGSASYVLATTSLTTGVHLLTAAYSGDSNYAGSKGALYLTIVIAAAGDFSLSPVNSTVSVASGGTATGIVFTVASLNGFTGNVTLSASSATSGLGATYSFNIDPVAIAPATAGTSTLTMLAYVANSRSGQGLDRLAYSTHKDKKPIPWSIGGILGGLFLIVIPRRGRRAPLLPAGLLALGMCFFSGCMDAPPSSSSQSVTNTPAGTYTILVTASGTNFAGTLVSHNAQVMFTVN
jgi:hypothetical protein